MSNSIWKKPEERPKSFSSIVEHHKAYDFDNHKIITVYDIFESGGNPGCPFDENTIRWCYLDQLLAQADKAERLQKAVENYEKVIVGAMFAPDVGAVTAEMLEESHKTIKQLIKEQ